MFHLQDTIQFKNFSRRLGLSLIVLLALIIGGSWLLIVYFLDGQGVLNQIKLNLQTGRAGQMQSVTSVLARSASLSEHVELLAVYATPEFFELANRQAKGIPYDPDRSLIFIVNEDTHMGELPLEPTDVSLRINGGSALAPEQLEMLTYSIHHKVTIATFPKVDEAGRPLYSDQSAVLELVATSTEAPEHDHAAGSAVLRWQVPISYPEGALNQDGIPFSTTIAVAMGLLATVMTPCLIQLLLIYLSTLTGMSVEQLGSEGATIAPAARMRLMQIAFGFILGYTVLFTGAGALAGFAGETLQGAWGSVTRPLAIASGVIMVFLGLWMAIRSRAPLVCRIPLVKARLMGPESSKGGLLHSTLIGLTFAVGCSTCFGGALIATLLLYVGTLGSAWQGALILFFFSLGVGIPFLLAAALLTRVMPLMQRMHRFAPNIGLFSSAIVVIFGVLLITNKFHLVSAWITPLIGLS